MGRLAEAAHPEGPRILFYDLERLPGIGTRYLFEPTDIKHQGYWAPETWDVRPSDLPILCASWAWYGQRGTGFAAAWDDPDDHFHVARRMSELISSADVVMDFNGPKADRKWLRQAWAQGRVDTPMPPRWVDLYRVASSAFALERRSLSYLLDFLELPNKSGKYDPAQAWAAFDGDETARRRLERYSRGDSRVLPPLYERLRPFMPTTLNLGLLVMDDEDRCPACTSTDLEPDGWVKTNVTAFAAYRCRSCRTPMRSKHRKHAVSMRLVAQ